MSSKIIHIYSDEYEDTRVADKDCWMICGHIWKPGEQSALAANTTEVAWIDIDYIDEQRVKELLNARGCSKCTKILHMIEIVKALDPEER